jgi:hypothetical protein
VLIRQQPLISEKLGGSGSGTQQGTAKNKGVGIKSLKCLFASFRPLSLKINDPKLMPDFIKALDYTAPMKTNSFCKAQNFVSISVLYMMMN